MNKDIKDPLTPFYPRKTLPCQPQTPPTQYFTKRWKQLKHLKDLQRNKIQQPESENKKYSPQTSKFINFNIAQRINNKNFVIQEAQINEDQNQQNQLKLSFEFQSSSQESHVVFIGSRDIKGNAYEVFKDSDSRSLKCNKISRFNQQTLPSSTKDLWVSLEEYNILKRQNDELRSKNLRLQAQNQKLAQKLSAKQINQKDYRNIKLDKQKMPTFIKNREKNHKNLFVSPRNFNTTTPVNKSPEHFRHFSPRNSIPITLTDKNRLRQTLGHSNSTNGMPDINCSSKIQRCFSNNFYG